MKITWFGQACFLIEGNAHSDSEVSIVTDPYDSKIGLTLPTDLRADIVTVSHEHMDHSNTSAISGKSNGNPIIISTNGTHTVKIKNGAIITVTGIDSFHDSEKGAKRGANIIFKFIIDGITVAHLGDLGHVLTETQVRQLCSPSNVDILLIPVGGNYTINAQDAVTVTKQIQPKIVIPMHCGIPGLAFPLDPPENFIKLFLQTQTKQTQKMTKPIRDETTLEITKNSLARSAENSEIVLLKPLDRKA